MNTSILVKARGYNQPVSIKAPGGAKKLQDLFNSLSGPALNQPAAASADTPEYRDARRTSDMRQLVSAQEMWYGDKDKYYTCRVKSGDCGGKPRAYPAQIGVYLPTMPQDPLEGKSGAKTDVCGQSYSYCGLANAVYPQAFCYYAKLENGGYYTASQAGNFKRSTAPKTFKECATAN